MEFYNFDASHTILCIFLFNWWEMNPSDLGLLPLVIWTPKE